MPLLTRASGFLHMFLHLAELLRENKRMLDKSIREIERERQGLQTQEKKLITEIKKSAKQGQMVYQFFIFYKHLRGGFFLYLHLFHYQVFSLIIMMHLWVAWICAALVKLLLSWWVWLFGALWCSRILILHLNRKPSSLKNYFHDWKLEVLKSIASWSMFTSWILDFWDFAGQNLKYVLQGSKKHVMDDVIFTLEKHILVQ